MNQATRKPTTPGDILLYEYLEPLDLKINELAELLHVHRNSVSELINNNRKLTTEMAFRLAKVFDTTVEGCVNHTPGVFFLGCCKQNRTRATIRGK
ncbi:HigA family addiction module antitoxin, partial [Escherichia coli]